MTTSWARGTVRDTVTFRNVESAIATFTTGTETAPGAGARDGAYAAGTTYAASDFVSSGGKPYVSLQANNTGNDPATSPTWWALAGVSLMEMDGFNAYAETAAAMTAGGKFLAVMLNPETGSFCPVSDGSLDLTASAVTKQGWSGFSVSAGPGYLIPYPSGVGGANPLTLYLMGARNGHR